MVKGKYAAKAANRLAQIDSEVLRDVTAERDRLLRELAFEKSARQAEKLDVDARIVVEASRKSTTEIARIENDARNAVDQSNRARTAHAQWLTTYLKRLCELHPGIRIIPADLPDVFVQLTGDSAVGKYMAEILPELGNRDERRLTLAEIRKRREDHDVNYKEQKNSLRAQIGAAFNVKEA